MVSHRCHKCRWFDKEHISLKSIPDNFGYCRKHKPVIYQFEERYYGGWPLVDINDFCGEFREDEG
jgi:hypothetical protein